jgi:hypothetical protein
MVTRELEALDVDHLVFNQRRLVDASIHFAISDGSVSGTLEVQGVRLDLSSVTAVYTRLMDVALLPEIRDLAPAAPERLHAALAQDALVRWMEIAPACVINRIEPMASNHSKPYQAAIIAAHGFAVPETLITNQPEMVVEFRRKFGRVIYKSISGARSIVRELNDADDDRLDRIRWCPVQFQEYVAGLDVRVHVIGEDTIATAIHSNQPDYRYSEGEADLNPYQLDDAVASACVALTRDMGLVLSGIDLRVTPEGSIYCFEVNPSPAFSFYEAYSSQPIARRLAEYLASFEAGRRVPTSPTEVPLRV